MAAWGRSGAIAFETAALGEHVTRRPRQAIAGPTEDRTIGNETIRSRRSELGGREPVIDFAESMREPRSVFAPCADGRGKPGYLPYGSVGAVSANTQTVRRWARVSVIASVAFGALRSSDPIATAA